VATSRLSSAAAFPVNVASYCGLGSILALRPGRFFERPTAAQLQEIRLLLDEALRDGAIGLSSLLAGPPDLLATTDDIVELCREVARHGGRFSSHIRNEGTGVFDAVKEAISVGERAGVPVDIIHLKIADQKLWDA
jgi:N-acyl-D-aspartate/D-glutamate deacylase